jgi:hypothetical protein
MAHGITAKNCTFVSLYDKQDRIAYKNLSSNRRRDEIRLRVEPACKSRKDGDRKKIIFTLNN